MTGILRIVIYGEDHVTRGRDRSNADTRQGTQKNQQPLSEAGKSQERILLRVSEGHGPDDYLILGF